jgi:transposase
MVINELSLILPSDVNELQKMVLQMHAVIMEITTAKRNSDLENKLLRERLNHLIQQIYGRKSEKLSHSLLQSLDDGFKPSFLFDKSVEVEESGDIDGQCDNAEEEEDIEDDEFTIAGYKRKKPGRKALPDYLERVEVIHDISEEEKKCGCGLKKDCIGGVASENLQIQPAKMWVERHIRLKYACSCEGVGDVESDREINECAVTIAPVAVQLIPRSISSPSLLAHIFVSKFADSIPFYRQEKQLSRMGIKITRATMCTWATKIADKCNGLLELLRSEVLSGPLINVDETTFQVLDEPGRPAESKSYMWIFRGGPPGKITVLFRYDPSRNGKVARNFLDDYHGYVQTDGYGGYNFLDTQAGIVHIGCWAHIRRKFVEVIKAAEKNIDVIDDKDKGKAGEAIKFIRKLYRIERNTQVRGLDAESVRQLRQQESGPVLDDFEKWLKVNAPKVPPRCLLGRAIIYALKQWPRLIRYLGDGNVRMDNNLAENAIRPFVVGRKNWLFSGTPEGASASATLYSIIETAKANGLEPYHYLVYLFERLPFAYSDEALKMLLPQNLTPEIIAEKKFRAPDQSLQPVPNKAPSNGA